ncbi:hypothetical protein BYT27DRAFT_7193076 [Phlegmacium glaucopus]|nr:hypothetical protein BYT27DRAFT_7193076 [Phlegmacium glaucopus]
MTLRMMDSAHGIVANFFVPLSVATRLMGDRAYHPHFQEQIHTKEMLLTIPTRTINGLPTEILAHILSYFEDDVNALKTFSLISRPFLSVCRKYLFSTLRLNSLGSSFDHQCDSWMSILNHSIDLSSLRILELGPPIFRVRSHDPGACSDHWIKTLTRRVPSIHDQRVQTIIQHVLHPQTVILRFEFQAWKNFSLTFQETVIELIQRETVSSLSLEDTVDFPLVGLSKCRHLRDLSLISFNISESAYAPEHEVLGGSKGYLESLTLFASDECVETMISVLSSPQSLLDLTRLRRLSINSTGLDGRLAMKKIPLIARYITTLELRVGGQNVGYKMCNLGDFPCLRSLLISISYDRHKRPIRELATFLSKSDTSTPRTLEVLKILIRHDVPELQLEKSFEDTIRMFQHIDWKIMEQTLINHHLFPALCNFGLGLRHKDVGTFMNDHLMHNLYWSLAKLMPTLCVSMNPTIEVFDDRFEQFTE